MDCTKESAAVLSRRGVDVSCAVLSLQQLARLDAEEEGKKSVKKGFDLSEYYAPRVTLKR